MDIKSSSYLLQPVELRATSCVPKLRYCSLSGITDMECACNAVAVSVRSEAVVSRQEWRIESGLLHHSCTSSISDACLVL